MNPGGNMDWMLGDILRVTAVRNALVISRDGLLLGKSPDLLREDAERLAAACSGLQALGNEVAAQIVAMDSNTRQIMLEFDGGFLFLVAAGPGAALAVTTSDEVNAGLVAREMQQLVTRLGRHLTSPPRADTTIR